ncbi:hypothetical protein THAOC_02270, partial [Thalassiosira oceanica]
MPRPKTTSHLALCAVCGLNVLTTCCAFRSNLPSDNVTGRQKTITSSSYEPACDDVTKRTDQHNVVRSKILDLLRDIDSDSPSSERMGVESTVVHLVGTGRESQPEPRRLATEDSSAALRGGRCPLRQPRSVGRLDNGSSPRPLSDDMRREAGRRRNELEAGRHRRADQRDG